MASYLFGKFVKLTTRIKESDANWDYTEEPHTQRRKEILKKYPQIKKLMGYDPMIAVIVSAEVMAQLVMCYLVKDLAWGKLLILSYVIGASLNHSLGSAIHEIGHNLAFGHSKPMWNRVLGMICNLPMAIPLSVTYKKYHTDHHRWLGHETMDVDIPTRMETFLFRHWFTKIFWLLIHPVIHGIRPFIKSPQPLLPLEVINLIFQFTFNFAIYYVLGVKSLVYLVAGTLFGLGAHPLAAHFISEHYLFHGDEKATYSYYGPLNPILFNVGYHVEHHDFPYIPGTKLPKVKEIAPEYYDNLPHHTSWLRVLYDFIFDPQSGPQARGVGFRKDDINMSKYLCSKAMSNGIVNENGSLANGKTFSHKKKH